MTPEAMANTMVLLGWMQNGVTWMKPQPHGWCLVVTWGYHITNQRYPSTVHPPKYIEPHRMSNIYARVMEYEKQLDA